MASVNPLALLVLAGVLGAVVARQLLGRGPGVWLLFGVGGLATVGAGIVPPAGAAAVLVDEGPTLLFLLALFVFAAALVESGAIDHLARWLLGRARTPADLPFVLFVGIGLVSAVLINDALVVIGVPLLFAVATRLRADPRPLLLVLAFAVTVGSVLTPFGNPQNLLVAFAGGFADPIVTFLRYLALPTAINLVLGGWYLARRFGRRLGPADAAFAALRADAPPLWPRGGWATRVRQHPVLAVFPATIALLLGAEGASAVARLPVLPPWAPALAGATLVLLATPRRSAIARGVNVTVLVLFAGLFVVVAGAIAGGLLPGLEGLFPVPGPAHPLSATAAIVATSIVGPQLVSNVPWVGLQIPVLTGLGYSSATPVAWMALAGASTLAGNVTLLGAASNLILVDAAERRGVRIRLTEFAREGLPLSALTFAVLFGCLALGL